jgi:hypothetical protein
MRQSSSLHFAQRDGDGLADADALAELVFFFALDDELFAFFLRGLLVAEPVSDEVDVVINDSFESFAYGFASGLDVNVPPPADGAVAAGPLPVPD